MRVRGGIFTAVAASGNAERKRTYASGGNYTSYQLFHLFLLICGSAEILRAKYRAAVCCLILCIMPLYLPRQTFFRKKMNQAQSLAVLRPIHI